jgi:hypothetical protein
MYCECSIEFMKAGKKYEPGRAVVAGEAKGLSSQTARATEDIAAQVAQI